VVRIATSIGSSAATFASIFSAVSYWIDSLWPEDFSKAGANSCTAGCIASAHSTFNSAAAAVPVYRPASSGRTVATRKIPLFRTFSSPG